MSDATVQADDEPLLEWLRNSPSNEWNGPMLNRIARRLEALSRENLSLCKEMRHFKAELSAAHALHNEMARLIKHFQDD